MVRAIRQQQPDAVFHLGDCERDTQRLEKEFPDLPLYRVCGNCDREPVNPEVLQLTLDGVKFFLTHGHRYSVKYTLEKPVLTFSLESNDTATVLSIRDNGPGVRACDLPYVFEKGFTGDSGHEKNKATGMGLYLAREVAKDLGLTLTAASGWGAGFEIRVTFPVVEK